VASRKGPESLHTLSKDSVPSRCPYSVTLSQCLVLSLLGRSRDVLDHSPQFCPELLLAVIDAVQVSARTIHALNDPAGLPDVLVSHLIHRKLR
jgi:hypothetical protein